MNLTSAPRSFLACCTPSHADWLKLLSSILPTSVTRPTLSLEVPLLAPPLLLFELHAATKSDRAVIIMRTPRREAGFRFSTGAPAFIGLCHRSPLHLAQRSRCKAAVQHGPEA